MSEIFEVWHTYWLMPYALAFSVIMIAFEIMAGVAVLLGFAFRTFSFLLLLLNVFFTFLTAYAWFSGKVKECGCFGDCFKISNAATFYKDVALLVMAIILFAYRKRVMPLFGKYINLSLMIISLFLTVFVQWWALEHLPFHDCLPYKVGNNIYQKMQAPPGSTPDVYESVMIYEKDGMKKEFTTQNYPWQDSTWKFVDRRDKLVKKGNAEPEIKDYTLTDFDGNDHTQEVMTNKGKAFLWFVRDPATARTDNMDSLHALINRAVQMNVNFYVISSADANTSKVYQKKWNMEDIPWYILDVTVSKTAMRSNPGLLLLEDSVVKHKWSYRDYPTSKQLQDNKLEGK